MKNLKWPIVISFLTLLPLFRFGWGNGPDWHNHLWAITYFAEYFLKNGSFPLFFNTVQKVGYPLPLFYGGFFYKTLALLSIALGSGFAIRIYFWFFLILQYLLVHRLIRKFANDDILATIVTIMWSWSIYALTNLYARSALPEFFASMCLVCSLSCALLLIFDTENSLKSVIKWCPGFFFAFAATSHPITYLLGLISFGIIFLACFSYCQKKKKIFYILALNYFAAFICTLPWVYTAWRFSSHLTFNLNQIDMSTEYMWEPWLRLLPWPLDLRTFFSGTSISSPFLETQINVLLLSLFLALVCKWIRISKKDKKTRAELPLLIAGLLIFTVSFLMTVSQSFWNLFVPTLFYSIQMNYRMISYVNLGILIMLLGILLSFSSKFPKIKLSSERMRIYFAVLLTLSAVGLSQKWLSTFLVVSTREAVYTRPFSSKIQVTSFPPSYYNNFAYSTPSLFQQERNVLSDFPIDLVKFEPASNSHFGQTGQLIRDYSSPHFIGTNITPFLWNTLVINGAPTLLTMREGLLGTTVQSGHYVLEYKSKLDPLYYWLDWISTLVFYGWLSLIIWIGVNQRGLRQKRRKLS